MTSCGNDTSVSILQAMTANRKVIVDCTGYWKPSQTSLWWDSTLCFCHRLPFRLCQSRTKRLNLLETAKLQAFCSGDDCGRGEWNGRAEWIWHKNLFMASTVVITKLSRLFFLVSCSSSLKCIGQNWMLYISSFRFTIETCHFTLCPLPTPSQHCSTSQISTPGPLARTAWRRVETLRFQCHKNTFESGEF